jgi:hypothetical protein
MGNRIGPLRIHPGPSTMPMRLRFGGMRKGAL